jgi:preprotein translocase subunit SecB
MAAKRIRKARVAAGGLGAADGDYRQFLSSLQLIGVGLLSARFSINRQQFLSEKPAELELDTRYSPHPRGDAGFKVRASLTVTSKHAKSQSRSLNIAVDYELSFVLLGASDTRHVQRFAASDVSLIAWPYFREFINNMCSRAEIPGVVLPLIVGSK